MSSGEKDSREQTGEESGKETKKEAKIELIFSGDHYYLHALEQIQAAKSDIYLESYIFDLDPVGTRILSALQAAVQRGVQVRLLVDGVGSFNWLPKLAKECQDRKIHFRVYHPIPFGRSFWQQVSWKNILRIIYVFRRLNKRNHRKVLMVDQETVMLGSFNVSQVHSERMSGRKAWRDTGVLAKNLQQERDLIFLRAAFEEAWRTSRHFSLTNFRSFLPKKWVTQHQLDSRFRLNNRPNWRRQLLRDMNKKMKNAKKRIYITNAYFIPRKSILRSLRRAARRGVEVCLLLPEKTDVWFVREASRSLFYRLVTSGVKIYEYQDRVLHAKTMIIDDWATVGSHNFNHRSIMHDLEVETLITNPALIGKLMDQWQKDLRLSHLITREELGKVSWLRKGLGRVCYWFRYWI